LADVPTVTLIFRFEKVYEPLNLNRLQYLIDSKRLNPAEPITMYHLWRAGAVGKIQDGVKILGTVSIRVLPITT
jgi:large subunit ribosomal protein L15